MGTNARRLATVALVLGVVLTACNASDVFGLKVEKVGRRCTGNGFARDSKNVLQCKRGKWRVSMPIGKAIALIDAYNASQTTTTTTPAPQTPIMTALAAGRGHTCALRNDGTVSCFGLNTFGQLGNTTNNEPHTPNPRPALVAGLSGISAIAAGRGHTCALRKEGTVSCFGLNTFGQLGNTANTATDNPNPTPALVAGLSDITAITAGDTHTCALRNDGTVSCFGSNVYGELGNSTNNTTLNANPTPALVAGLTDITAITAGDNYTCALRNDGTVWCFGLNGAGQLGNATASPSPTPVLVAGMSGITAITAGDRHTCALRNDGTVYCFGENLYGQLGTDSNRTATSTPVNVADLANVTAITAGRGHTCALRNDGTVYCFGENYLGQLGTTTTYTTTPTPVNVVELVTIRAITAGDDHNCALKAGGTVSCFGFNKFGQLGSATNNETYNRNPIPLPVSW